MSTDFTVYAGRWVAMIGEQVVGVGQTPAEAKHLAHRNRPKERTTVQFVEAGGGRPFSLPPLLAQLRPFFRQQEQPVYLVGGAVRDVLLGRMSHDLDFVVPEQAIKLAFKVADTLGVPAYVLDKERDTGRVVLPQTGTVLDFARFRGENLEADLRDRDFTINAIALPATAQTSASLIDPCNGVEDLAHQQIRLTHPEAIQDDPVRALRAVRLALSLGFSLPAATQTAVSAAHATLLTTSIERIRDELLKLLQTAAPHQAMQQLHNLGLLRPILPEIAALDGLAQSAPHHEPVLDHTISVLRWLVAVETAVFETPSPINSGLHLAHTALQPYVPGLVAHLERMVDGGINGRTLLKLGALFHDVGKQETQTVEENGRIRFLGHDKIGAVIAANRLHHMAFSNKAAAHVELMVAGHMRPLLMLSSFRHLPGRRAIFRFFRDTQMAGLDIGLLSLADHLATYNGIGDLEHWTHLVNLVAELYHHYFEKHTQTVAPPPLLNGDELMKALNLEPGPEIGRLLRLIEEGQAAGEITTQAAALQFAQRNRR